MHSTEPKGENQAGSTDSVEGNHSFAGEAQGIPFEDFVFDNVRELAERVLAYHDRNDAKTKDRIQNGRGQIAGFSRSYLEKIGYGLPDSVRSAASEKIEMLGGAESDDAIILMSAHQPNLFAYSGVLRKIALLKALEREISKTRNPKQIICFYGIADHDFVHNKWVRSAEMPAPLRKEGTLRFNIDIDKKDLYLPTNKIEKPSIEKLDSWHSQIDGWMSENCSLAMKYAKSHNLKSAQKNILELVKNSFERYWECVQHAQEKAENLAEFSSFTLSTLVNTIFDTPVVFANFSDCFTAFGPEYRLLLSRSDEYSNIIKENEKRIKLNSIESGLASDVAELLPVWMKCGCGSKYRMAASTSPDTGFYGKCMHCDKEIKCTKEEIMAMSESSPQVFEPRSISMSLVFARAFDMSCYVGGSGGLGYLMHTREIGKKFGWRLPPMPYWNVPDRYIGVETLAAANEVQRIASAYGLKISGNSLDLIVSTAEMVSADMNSKMKEGNIPKTAVSERERQLLEKIPASLKAPACSIDYAINIGMDSTYKQWVDFLGNKRSLQETVELKSILSYP